MLTRARQRALQQREIQQQTEDKDIMTDEADLDLTIVENPQVGVGDDINISHSANHSTAGNINEQLALIIRGISDLRSTVDILQRESGENQGEIRILRQHIDRQASCGMQQPICSTSLPCDTAATYTSSMSDNGTRQQNVPVANRVPTAIPQSTTSLHMPATQFFQPDNTAQPCMTSSPNLYNTTSLTVDHIVKLYPLPVFNGKPEDWPLFLANFNDTTREFAYNNKHNLMRLQKAVQGEARLAVQSLLIYPNDVPKVIEELHFNFGRPDLLIRSQINQIQQISVIHEDNLDAIIALSNRVRNMVALFKSSNCGQHLMNTTLLEQLVTKLPRSKQYEWVKYAANIQPFPTVENFENWISDTARVICLMPVTPAACGRQYTRSSAVATSGSRQQPHFSASSRSTSSEIKRVLQTSDNNTNKTQPLCAQCKGSHFLKDCSDFKALTVDERWQLVKCQRLCISCLHKGHILLNCRKKKSCGIDGCNRPHHILLHQHATPEGSSQGSPTQHVYNCRQNEPHKQLFRILPVTLTGPQGTLSVFAMLDEGSSVTLLEEDTAKLLGLKGQTKPLTLQWYDDQLRTENSRIVTVDITGEGKNCLTYTLKNIRTLKELNLPRQSFHKDWYSSLMSLPISSYDDVKPVILIGLDNCYLGVPKEVVEGVVNKLVATNTKLGWVAFGPLDNTAVDNPRVLHVRESSAMRNIASLVEDYFSTENFGVRANEVVLESDDTARAKQILSESTQKIGLRYETGLLWREDNVRMPESYKMARDRLYKVENRMASDSKYAELYKREIDKYIAKGYAKLLSPDELTSKSRIVWYLPHFGVFNPNKPNKIRVVFDAAAKSNNVSLNSMLLKGPEHAQSLFQIMFKFRQGTVAVAGDIEEMFSQVKIQAKDQHAQRFLWRDGDRTAPIRVYMMTSMIFGAICSPCSAEYIKNVNATCHMSATPKGATAVIDNTYVDDFVMSFYSEQDAFEVTEEAIEINATAGFNLRRFVSNCKALEEKFNAGQTNDVSILSMTHQVQTDKILGLFWDKTEDAFRFQFQFNKIPQDVLQSIRPPTKREMLGIVMAVYDPFGFLSNFTIFMKLLLQSTWKRRLGWEEPIPHQLFLLWSEWWVEFQKVKDFSVPRCYTPLLKEAEDVQLHIFVDASASAFAAVAYLRVQKDGLVQVAFVSAKTRAAPIKELSTPRLELQAAVLGSRLKTTIHQSHDFTINSTTFWSDSKTVILWIQSKQREYKQFVAARIAEILSVSKPSEWRWLPSKANVADDATRAGTPPRFDISSRWINGPEFLHKHSKFWPTIISLPSEERLPEERPANFLLLQTTKPYLLEMEKFSSYTRLLRVASWVLRFVRNIRNIESRTSGELIASELSRAEQLICSQVQEQFYAKDILELRANGRVTKNSSIRELTPYLDDTALLRVAGRIDNALWLPTSARRPIILPRDSHLAFLIMMHYHQKNHHQNDSLIVNEMRQKFWVPQARMLLKTVKRSCVVCVINRANPRIPLMGQLPEDRLTPYIRPFSYVGIDYCGPFFVAIGRRREKRWVSLFTCLTTRAVHLEIATDLSTDAFILCFRNFVNRRGTPVRIRTDNGTNFIGAQRELVADKRLFDFERVQQVMARENIEWVFNCPANPNAGGCWERLVQCLKRLLVRVLKAEAPRLETFHSVLIEVENIINNRPLTDLPLTPDDEEPLTPNHFLLGCLNSTQTPAPSTEKICLRRQWRIAQNLKDKLWKRWTLEYLPQLLRRPKWSEKAPPLQPDQLVIIVDNKQPRSQWQMGKITKVFPAKDGQVRSAEVRTSNGVFRRPASKLAALILLEASPDKAPRGVECCLNVDGSPISEENAATASVRQ